MSIASSYNNVINDCRSPHEGESSTISSAYAKMLKQTPSILQQTPNSATFFIRSRICTCWIAVVREPHPVLYHYYAALLPRRGGGRGRILRRTLSVRLSVRPVIVTERHVAPSSELQWHTCTFQHALRAAYRMAISAAQILVIWLTPWKKSIDCNNFWYITLSEITWRLKITKLPTSTISCCTLPREDQ